MRKLVLSKFLLSAGLRERLLATKNMMLIEGNDWHDTYWGVCLGRGQNMLGKILMSVREELS
jgi:predicted NAD-dependent protein-ADP-ribosyltransferase YbiA (DUF1768 family)